MKSKSLFFAVFSLTLLLVGSAFNYSANQLPEMPKYDRKMFKPNVSCSSSAWFNDCSANCNDNQDCRCDGGIFFCSCYCSTPPSNGGGKPKQLAHNLPSVSENQYQNWIKFSNFLIKDLGTDNAKKAYLALVEMANSLIAQNEEKYNQQAIIINNLFKGMSEKEKKAVNEFFAKEKAGIVI